VFESETELVCRYLPDTTLTYVNDAYCQYFGKTREELLGRQFLELIPEPARAVAREHVQSLIREPRVVADEHEVVLPDGSIAWQQWIDLAAVDARGRVVELTAIGRDITARKRAAEELRDAQDRLQETIDALATRVAILDEQGMILAVNEPWRHFKQVHGSRLGILDVGANHLAACDAAGRRGNRAAARSAAGIRAVMVGRQESFQQVYGRPAGSQLAWFQLRVARSASGIGCAWS
jgi:PAS domain S-box-containing protein